MSQEGQRITKEEEQRDHAPDKGKNDGEEENYEEEKSTFFLDLHRFFSSRCFLTLHTKSRNDSLLLDGPLNLCSDDLVSLVGSSLL